MKSSTFPLLCGVALVAMSAAGFSHWWSVKSFVVLLDAGLPAGTPVVNPIVKPAGLAAQPAPQVAQNQKALPTPDATQKKFYESLISKMDSLQNQNRDLLDQMAETNRDVMKLEFRVDTHSESFRPMPVNEERSDTTFDSGPGVLPPRAEPVFPAFR